MVGVKRSRTARRNHYGNSGLEPSAVPCSDNSLRSVGTKTVIRVSVAGKKWQANSMFQEKPEARRKLSW